MTFKEYQDKTEETAIYRGSTRKLLASIEYNVLNISNAGTIEKLLNISYVALGLGEVGELQGKIKKIIRDNGGIITDEHRKAISKELGDILWYVSQTCAELGLDLELVAIQNIEKLNSRKVRGTLQGSGDDR